MKPKFKLLTIALATLGSLSATPASANIIGFGGNGVQNPGSTVSELALLVWDVNTKTSYVRDLGIEWNITTPGITPADMFGGSKSYSFTGDALYQTFLHGGTVPDTVTGVPKTYTDITKDIADGLVRWQVVSAVHSTAAGYGFVTTAKIQPTLQTKILLGATGTKWDTGPVQGIFPVDNTSILNDPGLSDALVDTWGNGLGQLPITMFGIVGQDSALDFYAQQLPIGAGGLTKAVNTKFATQWNFDSATGGLIYAPVPEPESWAMLLAGLGLIASATRRRFNLLR